MRIALLLGVLLPVLGHAQVPDHLKCYAIKDSLLSGVRNPVKSYTADLDGLAPEPGCVIKMPAKYLCVETTKANVQPTPPGSAAGPSAGQFLCYKVKCPKAALPSILENDQFGLHSVTPKSSKLVCAPAITSVVTTTTSSSSSTPSSSTITTTSSCPPATAAYCGSADCGPGGMPGCPQFPGLPPLCPSGMTCTATGATSCACTGESIPCGDPRLSGLTCNFCKWGTCPPGMTCGGVPKQGECGFDCACH
jgi:hypothetical protein